jgi:hypothetical protein
MSTGVELDLTAAYADFKWEMRDTAFLRATLGGKQGQIPV